MEDLGPGPSLADSLLNGDHSHVRADLVSYAEALGAMHAWSMRRPRDPRLGTPPWPGAIARGKDAFLGAAVSLGLAAAGARTEIDQLSVILNETGYHGLVHGDACPDNVRFLGGRCRIFDFGHSGWGPVVLDASYLLAPFPSCWCFGRLPDSVAAPAMSAYRGCLQAAGIDLGPFGPGWKTHSNYLRPCRRSRRSLPHRCDRKSGRRIRTRSRWINGCADWLGDCPLRATP
jgi:hypothetical protein